MNVTRPMPPSPLAEAVGGAVEGDGARAVAFVASPDEAGPNDLTLVLSGQVGISDEVILGDRTEIGARSGAMSGVEVAGGAPGGAAPAGRLAAVARAVPGGAEAEAAGGGAW